MKHLLSQTISRRSVLAAGALSFSAPLTLSTAHGASTPAFNVITGRPTSNSVALSIMSSIDVDAYIEYGVSKTVLNRKTTTFGLNSMRPTIFDIEKLSGNTTYYYRINYRSSSSQVFAKSDTAKFMTQKRPGKTFSFTLQGDTHPERAGKMFNSDLYYITMANIATQSPDFHILLGDDFSIDPLISKSQATQENVEKIYRTHRNWLGVIGKLTALFHVNGNHEQAAKYLLDGTNGNPAVLAGNARLKYFPLPAPDSFFTGDDEEIPFVGKPRDYYSWTWGDALFVTLDPYWHSGSAVDNVAGVSNDQDQQTKSGGAGKAKDLWQIGLGDTQYFWLKKTLETSKAKFKFVFAHHVMGTGRGGIEVSTDYEWGGADPKKQTTFAQMRPNWPLPIHDLMVKNGVTIFFQGHDHIFVTQERDGLIYQSMPNPADDTFSMFNDAAYKSGTKAPNSGHVRVTVSSTQAKVEYFLAAKPNDTRRKNLALAHSYIVKPKMQ